MFGSDYIKFKKIYRSASLKNYCNGFGNERTKDN